MDIMNLHMQTNVPWTMWRRKDCGSGRWKWTFHVAVHKERRLWLLLFSSDFLAQQDQLTKILKCDILLIGRWEWLKVQHTQFIRRVFCIKWYSVFTSTMKTAKISSKTSKQPNNCFVSPLTYAKNDVVKSSKEKSHSIWRATSNLARKKQTIWA